MNQAKSSIGNEGIPIGDGQPFRHQWNIANTDVVSITRVSPLEDDDRPVLLVLSTGLLAAGPLVLQCECRESRPDRNIPLPGEEDATLFFSLSSHRLTLLILFKQIK